jgi:hypothetical protein
LYATGSKPYISKSEIDNLQPMGQHTSKVNKLADKSTPKQPKKLESLKDTSKQTSIYIELGLNRDCKDTTRKDLSKHFESPTYQQVILLTPTHKRAERTPGVTPGTNTHDLSTSDVTPESQSKRPLFGENSRSRHTIVSMRGRDVLFEHLQDHSENPRDKPSRVAPHAKSMEYEFSPISPISPHSMLKIQSGIALSL